MKDFEQLYYDAIYQIKNLESEKENLKQELEIYKKLFINKDLKKIIANDLIKYLKKKDGD